MTDAATISDRLDRYPQNHRGQVRDLAEMVVMATSGGAEGEMLGDPEDERHAVFQECVALYRREHGIAEPELTTALAEWKAIAD